MDVLVLSLTRLQVSEVLMHGRNELFTTSRIRQDRLRLSPIVIVKERANNHEMIAFQESICAEYNKLAKQIDPIHARQLNSNDYTHPTTMDTIVGVSKSHILYQSLNGHIGFIYQAYFIALVEFHSKNVTLKPNCWRLRLRKSSVKNL